MFRKTASGRTSQAKYIDVEPLPPIESVPEGRQRETLVELYKTQNLNEIQDFLHERGFPSVFDLVAEVLRNSEKDNNQQVNDWFSNDGFSQFFSQCIQHPAFIKKSSHHSEKFRDDISSVAGQILRTEFNGMIKSKVLQKPLESYGPGDITGLEFTSMQNELDTKAPRLISILRNIVLKNHSNLEVDAEEVETDQEHEASLLTSIGHLETQSYKRKRVGRPRNRDLLINNAIALLCYARSSKVNLLQSLTGYYLMATNTSKRAIEVLHQLGHSVTYTSVSAALRGNAEAAKRELREMCKQGGVFFVSFDNMNFYARVRDQTLHNQSVLQNYTAGYVAFNPAYSDVQLFPSSSVDRSKVKQLTTEDFFPSENCMLHLEKAFRGHIYHILNSYCAPQIRKSAKERNLDPFLYPEIHKLPVQKTKIFTLPAFNKNEALISETSEILKQIREELELTTEQLRNKTIMYKGDFMTVRNIR